MNPNVPLARTTLNWTDWGQLDALGFAQRVQDGDVTPLQLAVQTREAVKQLNPSVNAIIEVFGDLVENPSKNEMNPDGKFYGVPFFLKDLGSGMKGRKQEKGSLLCKEEVAKEDDPLVRNFKSAGFNVLGRTTTPPFGHAMTTDSFISGVTRNPWNLEYTPGGSSGGAAASVAAGIVPAAMSSDGGGSTRSPASMCGLIGLKTTRGRIPFPVYANELAAPYTQEGVVTRTVRDSAHILDYMCQHELGDSIIPIQPPKLSYADAIKLNPGQLNIAVNTGQWGHKADIPQEISDRVYLVAQVLEELGHKVVEIDDDFCDWRTLWPSNLIPWFAATKFWKGLEKSGGPIIDETTLEPGLLAVYNAAQKFNEFDFATFQNDNALYTRAFGQLFQRYDLLLTPVDAVFTPIAGAGSGVSPLEDISTEAEAETWVDNLISASRYLIPANNAGFPAISVPTGLLSNDLPVGVQLSGPWLGEDGLLQVAAQIEQAKPEWFNLKPPVHVSSLRDQE